MEVVGDVISRLEVPLVEEPSLLLGFGAPGTFPAFNSSSFPGEDTDTLMEVELRREFKFMTRPSTQG